MNERETGESPQGGSFSFRVDNNLDPHCSGVFCLDTSVFSDEELRELINKTFKSHEK